nr:hypothetical protein BAR15_180192 [Bartonella sp. AR 15-3]
MYFYTLHTRKRRRKHFHTEMCFPLTIKSIFVMRMTCMKMAFINYFKLLRQESITQFCFNDCINRTRHLFPFTKMDIAANFSIQTLRELSVEINFLQVNSYQKDRSCIRQKYDNNI